jgi:hypothetical protein
MDHSLIVPQKRELKPEKTLSVSKARARSKKPIRELTLDINPFL